MKNKNIWQAVKFTLFSASAGIIQALSFWLLHDALLPKMLNGSETETLLFSLTADQLNQAISYIISLVLSVIWNFTFNRRYTFRSDADVPRAMGLVALYYLVFAPVSLWWSTALVGLRMPSERLQQFLPYLVEGGTMIVNLITEFLFQRFVVYRNSIDTNELARKENA